MKREIERSNMNAYRFLEYGSMIIAIISAIWLIITMIQVEFPGFAPRLLPPLVILLISGTVWGVMLVSDEVKRLGWPVAIASIVSLIITQFLALLISHIML